MGPEIWPHPILATLSNWSWRRIVPFQRGGGRVFILCATSIVGLLRQLGLFTLLLAKVIDNLLQPLTFAVSQCYNATS